MSERPWQDLLDEARGAWQAEAHHDALQLCDRAALCSSQGRYAAACLRGDVLLSLGDAAGALSSYDSVADPALADPRLDCSRGLALFEMVRFAEAHGALRSALRGDAKLPEAYFALGVMAEILGTGDEAEYFRRARRLSPYGYGRTPHLTAVQFEAAVQRALERLPERLRPAMHGMTVLVQELPRLEDLQHTQPALSPKVFGTQVRLLGANPPENLAAAGTPASIATDAAPGQPAILLFKRNLERSAHDETALVQAIRDTILQEAITALGLSQADFTNDWSEPTY